MRVGLLGAGRIGSLHAVVISGLPEVEAVFVGDVDMGRAKALAEEVGGEAGTIEEILDRGPDAVVIAASTSAHAGLIEAAVDAGIPAFCEKPIALGYEETLGIVERVESSGAVLQIGFQRRFDDGYVEAKRLVDDGSLGPCTLSGSLPTTPSRRTRGTSRPRAASSATSTSTTSTCCGG